MREDHGVHRAEHRRGGTCIYFVPKPRTGPQNPRETRPETAGLGRCRRHAPTLGGWPAVFETDGCGDHKLDENKA